MLVITYWNAVGNYRTHVLQPESPNYLKSLTLYNQKQLVIKDITQNHKTVDC